MFNARFLRQLGAVLLLAGLSTAVVAKEDIKASSATNPAPSEALSGFDRFEVAKITMGAPWAGQRPNEAALVNLQANLDERIGPWLAEVNARPAANEPERVLRIEPYVAGIRYISGGKRVFAGAFAGKSRVLLRVRLVDAASGELVAEPEFYQHAAGMAGAYSFGGADKAMLERVTGLVVEYLRGNWDSAVGGPTGGE
ncbi:hypothetical protein [Arenimonas caeni]|jgi:hypothetical protein|uniref:DUF4410 domain-containing protein n=1 Tax=Arenimonas caeni TaxID=2058085 RepID=A0A2P6MBD9_9GAMM|nr:hypothetical protein [Arenimonas caeni]MDY0021332.1 hypothetical protein [Arenimonas caeni]PRH83297.1 hypothetical protein C6N40_03875 [Arenimonas caeni]